MFHFIQTIVYGIYRLYVADSKWCKNKYRYLNWSQRACLHGKSKSHTNRWTIVTAYEWSRASLLRTEHHKFCIPWFFLGHANFVRCTPAQVVVNCWTFLDVKGPTLVNSPKITVSDYMLKIKVRASLHLQNTVVRCKHCFTKKKIKNVFTGILWRLALK